MTLTAIFIDSREPSHIQSQAYGVPSSTVTLLDCGDVWATTDALDLLIIERKTPSDLLGSIEDGRVFEQIARCRERSQWVYLVITGTLAHSLDGYTIADERVTRWRWRDVQGALLSIQEAGAGIVYCTDDSEFAATVQWLGRRERVQEKAIRTRTAARVMTTGEQILTALPGIGLQRAQTLLDEFAGNPTWALVWLSQLGTVYEVAGIKDGTKHNVRTALQLEPGQELHITRSRKEYSAPPEASLVVHGEAHVPAILNGAQGSREGAPAA